MIYKLVLYPRYVRLWFGSYSERFDTAGRDDPRIQEAITRCRASGFAVQVYNTQ